MTKINPAITLAAMASAMSSSNIMPQSSSLNKKGDCGKLNVVSLRKAKKAKRQQRKQSRK